tara:strand:- start:1563 stop:2060 length:498 start_codon:yes stop_codon:yes gene_type:complete
MVTRDQVEAAERFMEPINAGAFVYVKSEGEYLPVYSSYPLEDADTGLKRPTIQVILGDEDDPTRKLKQVDVISDVDMNKPVKVKGKPDKDYGQRVSFGKFLKNLATQDLFSYDDQDYQRPGKFRGGKGIRAAYQDAKYDPNDPPKGVFGTAKDIIDKHTLTARKA